MICLAAVLVLSQSAAFRDTAVVPFFREIDPRVAHFRTILRAPAGAATDLLVVLGSQRAWPDAWWSRGDLLGLFLQDRTRPGRVYKLELRKAEAQDLRVEVARHRPGELTLACRPEYGSGAWNLKFFFAAGSKKLLRDTGYRPFRVSAVIYDQGTPCFIAEDDKQFLALRPNARGGFDVLRGPAAERILSRVPVYEWWTPQECFRIVDRTQTVPAPRFGPQSRFSLFQRKDPSWGEIATGIEERSSGRARVYRLPQSTCPQFKVRRPAQFRLNGCPSDVPEEIGPRQVFEDRLWFAKSFYDSEGSGGIGAFGFFDPVARRYELFSPREAADWSGSALLAEKDAVWIGLAHRGEYGDSPGGLLRWDRATHQVTVYQVGAAIARIVRHRDLLYLATAEGPVTLRNGVLRQFLVDRTIAGEYCVLPR